VGFWMGKFWTKIFEDSSLLWIGMLELVTRTNIFLTRQKWGLIQYLVPYVYFMFQLDSLCFKSFNLIHYVSTICINWSFPSVLMFSHRLNWTRVQVSTCLSTYANRLQRVTKLIERTKLKLKINIKD
jgi:uncharacterized membrane protein